MDTTILEPERLPRTVFLGGTGTGKSSLINALLDRQQCEVARLGQIHTTQEASEHKLKWSEDKPSVHIIDLPGLQAAERFDEMDTQRAFALLKEQLSQADVGVMVIAYPTRQLDFECTLIEQLQQELQSDFLRSLQARREERKFPLLVVANQIDKADPIEEWDPENLTLDSPSTTKEQNIAEWLQHLKTTLPEQPLIDMQILPCCAGETIDGETAVEDRYGLEALNTAIEAALPATKRLTWTVYSRMYEDVQARAQKVIWAAAAAAAAAAAIPIPLSDAALIAPIQISMVLSLASLYGVKLSWSRAVGLLTPALGVIGGRWLAGSLLKFIPGAGSVVAAGVAGVLTLAFGQTYNYFFLRGEFNPDAEDLKSKLREFYTEVKRFRGRFEGEKESA